MDDFEVGQEVEFVMAWSTDEQHYRLPRHEQWKAAGNSCLWGNTGKIVGVRKINGIALYNVMFTADKRFVHMHWEHEIGEVLCREFCGNVLRLKEVK